MKKLLLFLLFPTIAFAHWISESDVAKVNAGEGGVAVFKSRAQCESIKGELCFQTGSVDLRKYKVKLAREGAWETPVNETACADSDACVALIGTPGFCPADAPPDDYTAFWGDRDGDEDLEAWCTRRAYIKALKEDSTLAATWSQADADALQEQADRVARKNQRDTVLKNCAKVALKANDLPPGQATTNELAQRQNKLKDCLAATLIELISLRLEVDDL